MITKAAKFISNFLSFTDTIEIEKNNVKRELVVEEKKLV